MTLPDLNNTIRSAFQEAADFLIDSFAKECKLVYEPKREACPNCFKNGQLSANLYNGTGPIPFTDGTICPYCQGQGFSYTEQTETISLRLIFLPKIITLPNNLPLRIPNGNLETRGYLSDLPKVQKAIEIIAQVPTEGYQHKRYSRLDQGVDNFSIIQNRYFSCLWERK